MTASAITGVEAATENLPTALIYANFRCNAEFMSNDGWERQYNEINILKGVVCAACAVRDCVLQEFGCRIRDRSVRPGQSESEVLNSMSCNISLRRYEINYRVFGTHLPLPPLHLISVVFQSLRSTCGTVLLRQSHRSIVGSRRR